MASVQNLYYRSTNVCIYVNILSSGEYGELSYTLSGDHASLFNIDANTGVVTVAAESVIDRETTPDIWLRAIASDNAPPQIRRSTSVPVSYLTVFVPTQRSRFQMLV